MRIYSWNVNGLRAIEKKGFIDWIKEEQPDILCIQETKIQREQINDKLNNIEGYRSYFSCAERKGYSGVATYTKEEPISVSYGIGIEKFDNEGRILICEYDNFMLFNIYFPNGQSSEERLSYKLEFYDALFKYCDNLKEKGKKLIICGDYNTAHKEIDLKNPKANSKTSGFLPIEREWIDNIIKRGYIDTFRYFHPDEIKYSWWSYRFNARKNNAGWRIDYHFVSDNMKDDILDAEILNEVTGSDHCPVVLILK
ncbi:MULTISPECIES: exodeoxyribonuclease III [Clostridium]|uniref:Exodeoxyribonuclease n=2 Tax=Clostridium TaxID=1485 RepID=A0A151ARF9_9CLOT|nr:MULTISPECIES: exodeoxyribonuclease III [Clostridium]KYH30172.1 exodeoxyribonuclease [Clostridium colicanis DSM 13634]MBE6044598.1 exodeoxyribonuclease III [Clostridium thermopalmarium]PRR76669.1 Exodeoxyribonuclease [Clostridium thermopalmarium DSM 5974]PVZ23004.1 exodeoxyribonuclease-3 [Clostridium thermopalmarium DSM 5974]